MVTSNSPLRGLVSSARGTSTRLVPSAQRLDAAVAEESGELRLEFLRLVEGRDVAFAVRQLGEFLRERRAASTGIAEIEHVDRAVEGAGGFEGAPLAVRFAIGDHSQMIRALFAS